MEISVKVTVDKPILFFDSIGKYPGEYVYEVSFHGLDPDGDAHNLSERLAKVLNVIEVYKPHEE